MVSTVILRRQAVRAYEFGRLRMAARVVAIVALLVLTVVWETGNASSAIMVGAVLTIATVMLRWWHRRRGDDVTAGLWAGLIPLATSLSVCHIGVGCSVNLAVVLCGTGGVVAGVLLERYAARPEIGMRARWLAAATVAALTSSLGCGALNAGAVVGILVGLAGGGVLSAVVRVTRNALLRH